MLKADASDHEVLGMLVTAWGGFGLLFEATAHDWPYSIWPRYSSGFATVFKELLVSYGSRFHQVKKVYKCIWVWGAAYALLFQREV